MKETCPLVLLLVLASTAACAGPKIGYDFDPQARFDGYRTYDWMLDRQEPTGDRRVDATHVDIRIRSAVGTQLLLKGYAAATDGKPDFFVAYYAGLSDLSADFSSTYMDPTMAGRPFILSADSRTMGKPRDETEPQFDSRITGSLLVDIIDATSNKLVWRGTAAGEFDPGLTSRERDQRMRSIVREMLSHFPPK